DAAQLEHGEEIRVGELVLEAEPDHLELGERDVTLERDERQPASAEECLQVRPRRENALGRDVRATVEDVVEYLEPEVGLRDLVDLGEGEGESQPYPRGVLPDRAPFVA